MTKDPAAKLLCHDNDTAALGHCYEPDFRLSIEATSVDSSSETSCFVQSIDEKAYIEIDRETFRDLVQLKIAGELHGLRELFYEALHQSGSNFPDSIASILQRIAER